jgi:hypothetical protein
MKTKLAVLIVLFAALLVPVILPSAPPDSPLLRNATAVVAVTPDAIVIGQSQAQFASYPNDSHRAIYPSPEKKLTESKFLCAPDVVCVVQGLAVLPPDVKCSQGEISFDATQWMPRIDNDGDDLPRAVANRIWKKLRDTFDPVSCFYFHTDAGRALLAENIDSPLAIVVAGYSKESNVPQIYTVRVQFDRQNERLLFPAPERVFPRDQVAQLPVGIPGNPPFAVVLGDQDMLTAVKSNEDPFGAIFRGFYVKRLPAAQLRLKDSPAATQEAVAWVASFIDLEGEFDQRIGGGSSIAIVRKGHPDAIVSMNHISSW